MPHDSMVQGRRIDRQERNCVQVPDIQVLYTACCPWHEIWRRPDNDFKIELVKYIYLTGNMILAA